MKKIISAIMILLLIFAFSACKKSSELDGTWKSTIDISDLINKNITQNDDGMSDFLKIKDFTVTVCCSFENGKFTRTLDKASLDKSVELFNAQIKSGCIEYFNSAEKHENAIGKTLDEMLSEQGTSIDELSKSILTESALKQITDSFSKEFSFTLDNAKIVDTAEGAYYKYALMNGKLVISESYNTGEAPEISALLFPMTLEKA